MHRPRDPHEIKTYQGHYGTSDPRKIKRIERKIFQFTGVHYAYEWGSADGAYRARRNPYPPGKRHDAYERGYWISVEANPN